MTKEIIRVTFFVLFLLGAAVNISFGLVKNKMNNVNSSKIKLSEPQKFGKMSIEETLSQRRSIRNFSEEALTDKQISQLLWAAQGITDSLKGFRTAPSAGALYPLEIYLVEPNGLFHYLPVSHQLEWLIKKDLRKHLADASFGQSFIASAPIDIVITAIFSRSSSKYGQRARRYVYLEAGHVAQNIHLQAVALGLDSVPVGAFADDKVKEILLLPKDVEPIYIVPVGYKR